MNIVRRVLSDWLIISAVCAVVILFATLCLAGLEKFETWRQQRYLTRPRVVDFQTRRSQLSAAAAGRRHA